MKRLILLSSVVLLALVSLGAESWPDLPGKLYWVKELDGGYAFCKMDFAEQSVTELGRYTGNRVVSASWSPDFSRVAFEAAAKDGTAEIMVLDFATGQVSQLTRDTGDNGDPAWSPDGRHIAFVSRRRDTAGLYVMKADGSRPRLMVSGMLSSPAWSPDGSQMLFAAMLASLNHSFSQSYAVIPPPLDSQHRSSELSSTSGAPNIFTLTFREEKDLWSPAPYGDVFRLVTRGGGFYDPAWSPSGRWIAMTRKGAGGGPSVCFTTEDNRGGGTIKSWTGFVNPTRPCWSPDSRLVACVLKDTLGLNSRIAVFPVHYSDRIPLDLDGFGVGWGW